jgi:MraZ protein|tara:strand:+ start:306 stop:758 length:453 start_codon:yes stop_codon:yes gene_type:complete
MFKGISNLSIDVKGRASMPQRYRSDFSSKNKSKLVITADKDKCLLIYTQSSWAIIEKKLSNLPSYNKEARFIQRLLIGYATESEIDSQGRFLIPIPLREYAGIQKKIILLGQGSKFELWSENIWNKNMKSWLVSQSNDDSNNNALSELKL